METILGQAASQDNLARVTGLVAVTLALLGVGVACSAAKNSRRRYGRAIDVVADDEAKGVAEDTSSDGRAIHHSQLSQWRSEGDDVSQYEAEYYVKHHREAVSQQRTTFYASLVAGIISLLLVLIGLSIAFVVGQSTGTITALVGVVPGALSGLLLIQSRAATKTSNETAVEVAKGVLRAAGMRQFQNMLGKVEDDRVSQDLVVLAALRGLFPGAKISELVAVVRKLELPLDATSGSSTAVDGQLDST